MTHLYQYLSCLDLEAILLLEFHPPEQLVLPFARQAALVLVPCPLCPQHPYLLVHLALQPAQPLLLAPRAVLPQPPLASRESWRPLALFSLQANYTQAHLTDI